MIYLSSMIRHHLIAMGGGGEKGVAFWKSNIDEYINLLEKHASGSL